MLKAYFLQKGVQNTLKECADWDLWNRWRYTFLQSEIICKL